MPEKEPPRSQREIAEILAPILFPSAYNYAARWPTPVNELRIKYGEEAADRYQAKKDYELFLLRENRFGEFLLRQYGIEPPYEQTVPARFPYINLDRALQNLTNAEE